MLTFIRRKLTRPASLGFTYFASIVLFAAIYCSLDRSFIQPTSIYDPQIQENREKIASIFANKYISDCDLPQGLPGENGSVNVNCSDSGFSFLISGGVFADEPTLRIKDWAFHDDPFKKRFRATRQAQIKSWADWYYKNALNPEDDVGRSLSGYAQIFPRANHTTFIDPELVPLLEKYGDEISGVIRSSASNFPRMLYFSVVTATTLGYGDIVPTSDIARKIVTVQVVCSVIIIGLFLNLIPIRSRID